MMRVNFIIDLDYVLKNYKLFYPKSEHLITILL